MVIFFSFKCDFVTEYEIHVGVVYNLKTTLTYEGLKLLNKPQHFKITDIYSVRQ